MPTPLPAKAPPTVKPKEEGHGLMPSGMSVKLEPPDPAQAGTLEPGTIIAERYRIDSLLGEGGMGKVYAAEHVHMRKQVAIKVLHAEMSTTPEVVARFEREAVAAGKITHPNVATATDFGRLANSSFFLVLEYVAGTDLRQAIAKGALSPERAVHIVRQIASAVGAAHAAGVVHRDLKPENIMLVDRDGDPDFVKVLDFGIAKLDAIGISDPGANRGSKDSLQGDGPSAQAAQPLTKLGAVFGTPDYMSPEQALGQPIDLRSDLYSIGVIFFELLSGERPFKGGAVTLMRAHVLDAVPALPPAVVEALGPRYNPVIQKLLQKSATERYATAAELIDVLDGLSGDPLPEPTPEAVKVLAPTTVQVEATALPSSPALTDSSSAFVPVRRRRAFGPLSWLILVACGGAGAYWLLETPAPVRGNLWDMVSTVGPRTSAAATMDSAAPSALSPASPPTQAAAPELDTSSAPQGIDSAGATETDEMSTAADDSASPALPASAGPHHLGPHVTQSRPASKPIHKTNKQPQPPPPRHPFIPPPSQWFKN